MMRVTLHLDSATALGLLREAIPAHRSVRAQCEVTLRERYGTGAPAATTVIRESPRPALAPPPETATRQPVEASATT